MKVVLAVLLAVLLMPAPIQADPALYAYMDVAEVDGPVEGVYVLNAKGWAAGVGVDVVGSFYIDGVYAASGIGDYRPDVCQAFHAQSLPCGMDLNKPCSYGSQLINTPHCVGLIRLFNITGLSSGAHTIQICLVHATATTASLYGACSPALTFTRP